ncbi:vWA domain-containing protein [Arenibacter sp. F20364]|uniref:vWA domain-containing protein n=1 Tax=Arenibacter sp. F20364 TaxID=2926415 RepID=UPI001FF4FC54|nr:vWA domain-containing protein [Arenibacter sp. F20364]MCK0191135.1 VWA domain-containing protein [Arenibacter sp. F20364]
MMQIQTVLFILLAAIVALALVLFQYYYKSKRKGKLKVILSFLRFLAIFGTLLLVINPKFTKNEYSLEKPNLVLLADNSSSITSEDKARIISNFSSLKNNATTLLETFNISNFRFGADLTNSDSLSLTEKSTNISKALASLNDIYTGSNTAVILFSDGNQTIGEDYEFYGKRQKFPIYPIVLGDTTKYDDILISQVNANRYAFLKNKFPLEVLISYDGKTEASSELQVLVDGRLAHKEKVTLSNVSNAKVISTLIEASTVGIKNIKVILAPLPNEKNTANNQKMLALEVLDEKTNVAIISTVQHPDIGALKKAIESNEQRLVSIYRPNTDLSKLQEVDVYILYQPDASFDKIYKQIQAKQANSFTILGTSTDLNFIDKIQNKYLIETGYPVQELFAVPNTAFTKFDISDFSLEGFPPLLSDAGPVNVLGKGEPLINVRIKGVDMNQPLLTITEDDNAKHAILVGENIWKWRIQNYRNDQSFKHFDAFLGKLILYLTTSKGKNRFVLDYNPVYNNSSETKIKATYFDEAFAFDSNASINIKVVNTSTNASLEVPLLLKDGYYEADLSNLPAGEYDFTTTVTKENLSRSGSFSVLDFDAEKQFSSSNYGKLKRLANNTKGKLYFPNQMDSLIQTLETDPRYVPTQKSKQIVVPLIDFKFLLGIIIAALSLEWFIRKYNGLT